MNESAKSIIGAEKNNGKFIANRPMPESKKILSKKAKTKKKGESG